MLNSKQQQKSSVHVKTVLVTHQTQMFVQLASDFQELSLQLTNKQLSMQSRQVLLLVQEFPHTFFLIENTIIIQTFQKHIKFLKTNSHFALVVESNLTVENLFASTTFIWKKMLENSSMTHSLIKHSLTTTVVAFHCLNMSQKLTFQVPMKPLNF